MRKYLLFIAFALTTTFLQGQIVNIPDAAFQIALLNYSPTIDKNNDKLIQVNEAVLVTNLTVSNKSIKDLTGIQAFTALTTLYCNDNQLTALDLSKNTKLTTLYCNNNQITALDVSKNIALTSLICYSNKITALDVSMITYLNTLSCSSNPLMTIDVSKNTSLSSLFCNTNQLTTLDISKNYNLTTLTCAYNQLMVLDLSKNAGLTTLECAANQLTSLDLRKNANISMVACPSNPKLYTICVNANQLSLANTRMWIKDPIATWSTSCVITGIEEDILILDNTKELYRIVTPLGQEVRREQAIDGVFIYQYTDGSTKKIAK